MGDPHTRGCPQPTLNRELGYRYERGTVSVAAASSLTSHISATTPKDTLRTSMLTLSSPSLHSG